MSTSPQVSPDASFGVLHLGNDGTMAADPEARRLLLLDEGASSLDDLRQFPELAGVLREADAEVRARGGDFHGDAESGGRRFEVFAHPHGEAVHAVVVDSTLRHRLEERLHRAHRLESMSSLSGDLAHEFNNILTAILGLSDLMVLDARDTPSRLLLSQIQGAARRGIGLTNQLLAFSRRYRMAEGACDPVAVFSDVIDLVRHTVPRKVEVRAEVEPAPGPVRGDAGQLRSAFLNLGLNARDAMPSGGVLTFRCSTVEREAEAQDLFPEAGPGRYLLFEVADTGTGIPPEVGRHLFQPFFTTHEPGRRSGLGLATTYGIVRSHDGHIAYESTPGEGTTFSLLLPLRPLEVRGPAEAPPAPAPRAEPGGELVLFVDDEESIRLFAGAALRRQGYRALLASNGAEALDHVRAHCQDIDLVLLDLTMPVMGGPETFEKIREICPGARVVAMSGYGADERSDRLMSRGAVGFLAKPFDVSDLLAAVDNALRGAPV